MQYIDEEKPSTMPGVKTFVQQAITDLEMAHDAIIESRVVQTYHANRKWNEGKALQAGDLVYLFMVNLTHAKRTSKEAHSKIHRTNKGPTKERCDQYLYFGFTRKYA